MVNKISQFKRVLSKPTHYVANILMSSLLIPFFAMSPTPLIIKSAYADTFAGHSKTYSMLKWEELLPEADLKALREGPKTSLLTGRADVIDSPLATKLGKPRDAYQRALMSKKVRIEYNNKKVKLPGFIVPIDIEGEGVVKKFFFVPYFGQCLHLPPPPPNQIVIADFAKGYDMKDMDIQKPYYLEMTLHTKQAQKSNVTSAYTGTVDKIYPYESQ